MRAFEGADVDVFLMVTLVEVLAVASVGNSGGMVGVLEGRFFSSSKRFRISSQV